jgi:NitT/TauT family transport system permease protein
MAKQMHWLSLTVLLLVWQGAVSFEAAPPYLLPSPLDVLQTLRRIGGSGELLIALLMTLQRIVLGFAIAAVGGVGLGLLLARSNQLSATFSPMVLGLQSLPSICWFPLAILWIGLNDGAILFVTVVGALFAIAAATEAAIRTIPPGYLKAGATMGASGVRLYTRVMLPAALPSLLTGLRVGWSFAWRSLMAAELLFMNLGLGHLLNMGRELVDVAQVVAIILVILLVGLLVDRLVFARSERAMRRRWGFEAVS